MNKFPLICANWKMHKTPNEGQIFTESLMRKAKYSKLNIVIFPSIASLIPIWQSLNTHNKENLAKLKLGAQNIHTEIEGPFTGETSLEQVKKTINYVLIGHSERRLIFNESNQDTNKKLKNALKYPHITPILIVGEPQKVRDSKLTSEYLKTQITEAFEGIIESQIKNLAIAYEPLWAISSDTLFKIAPSPEEIDHEAKYIRQIISELYSDSLAKKIHILYGGSVSPDNTKKIFKAKNINGLLIGSCSLELSTFENILNQII